MAGTTNRVANQGVWISAGFATMNDSSLVLSGQLGQVVVQNQTAYQLVQFDASTPAIAIGTPVLWKTPASFLVTADYDVDLAGRNKPAGVAQLAMTAGNYGWIQVQGPSVVPLVTDGGGAAVGATLVLAGADGQVTGVAAGTAPTYAPMAIATAAESSSKQAGYICAPHNGW